MTRRPSRTGPCSVPDCSRTRYCSGMCSGHYRRMKAFGDPNGGLPVGTRVGVQVHDRDYILGEIEWLREGGASAFEICDALGFKPRTLERLMFRWDRHDIASFFTEAA